VKSLCLCPNIHEFYPTLRSFTDHWRRQEANVCLNGAQYGSLGDFTSVTTIHLIPAGISYTCV
ncbi:hypothetical protein ACJX0J_014475, partial [Zea mays]